jgi:hypothetical protein
MLGGWADIIRIHAMGRPAGVDGRILVDKSFCSKWCNWCFVIIKTSIHFFVC